MVRHQISLSFFFALILSVHSFGQGWGEPSKLKNPLSTRYEQYFGTAMDTYGGTTFVTSRSGQVGQVIVYELDTNCGWTQTQTIVSPLNNNELGGSFGVSIDIFEDIAVIGATSLTSKDLSGNDVMGSGAAFVYTRTQGGKWILEQALAASDLHIYAQFGLSVTTNGESIAVGARNSSVKRGNEVFEHAGAVYLFKRDKSGKWKQQKRLIKPERDKGGGFGNSVLMDGSTMIIGGRSYVYDNNGQSHGIAYFYKADHLGEWSLKSRILNPEKKVYTEFAEEAVAIEGNLIAIADPVNNFDANGKAELEYSGAVFLYRIKDDSTEFIQKITATDRSRKARFGTSLSLSNEQLAVGSPSNTVSNLTSGSTHIFELDGNGTWTESQRLLPKDRVWKDGMGFRVTQCGSQLLVAAPYASQNGKLYVYEHSDTSLFVRSSSGVLSASLSGSRYQWIDCHSKLPVSGATSRCFQPTEHGSYAVRVLVGKAFITSDCEGVWPLTIDGSQENRATIEAYPNPASTSLFVRQSIQTGSEMHLVLLDLNGRVWHQQNFKTDQTQFSIEHLPAGIYLLQVQTGHTSHVQKIVVQR